MEGEPARILVRRAIFSKKMRPLSERTDAPELRAFLEEADDQRADERLGALIFDVAEPLIRRIVNYRLSSGVLAQDREDLCADVQVELITRLRQSRDSTQPPIENFAGYVAVVSYHACDRFFRQRHPQRHRLKNRVRYFLDQDPRYTVWDEAGDLLGGLVEWQGRPAVPGAMVNGVVAGSPVRLGPALASIFAQAQAPVRLNDMIGLLARHWDIGDHQLPMEALTFRPDGAPGAAAVLTQKQDLARLWVEVTQLPLAQRTALLLNLRDEQGGSALAYLPASGVATIRQIAALLELPAEELAGLWRRLPLSDLEIAARLAISRQQVINLRHSARQRLGRRWAKETK